MTRTTVAALIAAGIVGVAGGAVAAVVRGNGDAPAPTPGASSTRTPPSSPSSGEDSPSGEPSPSGTASPTAGTAPTETNEPLLYADGPRIHDGKTVVPFRHGRIERLARVTHGWLVATAASVEDFSTSNLWWVTGSGSARRVAEVSNWDPDTDGRRVVGYDAKAGQVKVWSLPTLRVTGVYATEGSPVLTPVFAGHDVLIAQDIETEIDLVRWNPDTGKSTITGTGYDTVSASPGGSYLSGAVGPEGVSTETDPCLHVESTFLKEQNVSWTTCDWVGDGNPVAFSPDGTRLIAVPSGTDGFGPGEFGVIDASDGPRTLVATVKAPPLTLGAQWADNDHLYLYGSATDDLANGGGWIRRCDLAGSCTEVASSKNILTLGSGL